MPQELFGITGPSRFTPECREMAETYFNTNYVDLTQSTWSNVQKHLLNCSAVILAGGGDIHPSIYGNNYSNKSSYQKYGMQVLGDVNYSEFNLERDLMELQTIEFCFAHGIPILGICRGHQMLGIYHGLELLPEVNDGAICHNPNRLNHKENTNPYHSVLIRSPNIRVPEASERLAAYKILHQKMDTRFLVNSFHHQGVAWDSKKLDNLYFDDGVYIDGVTKYDQKEEIHLIEMMHGSQDKRWMSVQWHPEFDWKKNSYSRFVLAIFASMVKNTITFDQALVDVYSKKDFVFTQKKEQAKPA